MPPEQIDLLEERVTRLEEQTRNDIVLIHTKLDKLLAAINDAAISSAKHSCPSPGACIGLGADLRNQVVLLNANTLRVERLELRMMELEKWQGRLFGGATVIMTVLTLFAPALRKLFNLE